MRSDQILGHVEKALVEEAGFSREAVLRDYAYADYMGPQHEVREVALAAFAESPPSYRSACVAVSQVSADSAAPTELTSLRALGAPRVITIGPSRASFWRLGEADRPEHLEDQPRAEIANVIRTRAADWSPKAILRASQVVGPGPYQLDFGDIGLVPLIERQVNEKLDSLIHDVIAGCIDRDPALQDRPGFRKLVREVFWMLTAKVLSDRKHPSIARQPSSADQALVLGRQHYARTLTAQALPKPVRRDAVAPEIVDWAWRRIREGFHFQNVSVDALAFVYENTLVSPDVRRRLGVHGTPRAVAELVASLLPIEDLPEDRDVILEPCAGFGPFLLAALRRLRSCASAGLDVPERHDELVRRLRGIEIDAFSTEVGRLCLTLADYPNADGWQLIPDDVFAPKVLEGASPNVGVVMANPPFESFSQRDVRRYGAVRTEKPGELLRRVLDVTAPVHLGFVLPRMALDSPRSGYRELRDTIRRDYREVDAIDLPDTVFEYSNAETVLLIARDRRTGPRTTRRSARVLPGEVEDVLRGHWIPKWLTDSIDSRGTGPATLRVDEMAEIWERLAHLDTLSEVAEIHRGIEYKKSIKSAGSELFSDKPHSNMALGVRLGRDLTAYQFLRVVYMNTIPGEIRRSGNYRWGSPKVIVNAARRSRGSWLLTAASDLKGLWCYQRLFGIWPADVIEWPFELIAAILNGPVANAYVGPRKDIHQRILKAIPLPDNSALDVPRIVDLVRRVMERPDLETILRIDAEILRGYDLPPRLERRLLLRFEGEERRGILGFQGYYPPDFDSALPLHRILTELTDDYRADRLLERVPVFHQPEVSEMFELLSAGFGG